MEDYSDKRTGLNRGNRNLIVATVTISLLIFGPIEPCGIFVRCAYLVIIPALFWIGLRYWGSNWRMDKLSNDRLFRAIMGTIVGALLVGASFSYMLKYHTECDKYIQTRDGQECVGDYIVVKGSDRTGALMQVVFAGIAIWLAVAKRSEKDY